MYKDTQGEKDKKLDNEVQGQRSKAVERKGEREKRKRQ
jgi:hypothetical protein